MSGYVFTCDDCLKETTIHEDFTKEDALSMVADKGWYVDKYTTLCPSCLEDAELEGDDRIKEGA